MSRLPPDMKHYRAKRSFSMTILILSVASLIATTVLVAHMDEQLHQARLEQIKTANQIQCTQT